MGLALAVKRVYRFYDVSPKRWVRNSADSIFFYAVGLFTGMEVGSVKVSTTWVLVFWAVFFVLNWWARTGNVDRERASEAK